jgi:hypothetical protein
MLDYEFVGVKKAIEWEKRSWKLLTAINEHFEHSFFASLFKGLWGLRQRKDFLDQGMDTDPLVSQKMHSQAHIPASGTKKSNFIDYDPGHVHGRRGCGCGLDYHSSLGADKVQGGINALGLACTIYNQIKSCIFRIWYLP